MSRIDPNGTPYRRRMEDRRSRASRVSLAVGLLMLVLVVLYYLIQTTVEVRNLREDLVAAQEQTRAAEERSARERAELLVRLDTLQADLDTARSEVASLREQLLAEGITPVGTELDSDPRPMPEAERAATGSRAAPGAPETAPEARTAPEAAPGAPAPAPVAPAAPAAPIPAPAPAPAVPAQPEPPRSGLVTDEPILCVLRLCV